MFWTGVIVNDTRLFSSLLSLSLSLRLVLSDRAFLLLEYLGVGSDDSLQAWKS